MPTNATTGEPKYIPITSQVMYQWFRPMVREFYEFLQVPVPHAVENDLLTLEVFGPNAHPDLQRQAFERFFRPASVRISRAQCDIFGYVALFNES